MPHIESVKRQREALRFEDRPTPAELAEIERIRPRVRGDCISGPRPCPWISCRHHLGLDVKDSGSLLINYDGEDGPTGNGFQPTCALDIADRYEELTLDSIGALFGVTREWIRKIEESGLYHLAVALKGSGDHP